MEKLNFIESLYNSYKAWVCNNASAVTDTETLVTWSSYFIAGKINKSPIVSELVYSISKLLTLFNDRLIQEAYGGEAKPPFGPSDKIKLWLTILHYCEVFVELTVRKKWGSSGKWSIATILQLVKCSSALVLLYKFKESPILHPPIPLLQRKKLLESKVVDENCNSKFVLKRTGRVIRRVEGAPPVALRTWQPLESLTGGDSGHQQLNLKTIRYAETLHIIKPILHLASVKVFGSESWKQWLTALCVDLTSLHLYSKQRQFLTYEQKIEISRRKFALLLYLLRSPVYHKYSRAIIMKMLNGTARRIPATGFICNPILQYLSHWQDIYFYMWTS